MTSTDIFEFAMVGYAGFFIGYVMHLGRTVLTIRDTLQDINQRLGQVTLHTAKLSAATDVTGCVRTLRGDIAHLDEGCTCAAPITDTEHPSD